MNVTFVKPQSTYGLLTTEEKTKVKKAQGENADHLRIPRRPHWDRTTSGEELQQMEREAFMAWRKSLSELQEVDGITLTPYEKNLDFWRQLWRVIERSDVSTLTLLQQRLAHQLPLFFQIVVQIVDARNPLLFRSEDLERYVKETSCEKMNLILINKADFLSEKQRKMWADYFGKIGLPVAFFSALEENQNHLALIREMKIDEGGEDEEEDYEEEEEEEEEVEEASDEEAVEEEETSEDGDADEDADDENDAAKEVVKSDIPPRKTATEEKPDSPPGVETGGIKNSSRLLTRGDLIQLFKTVHKGAKVQPGRTVVGLVGYPNVGKSSTINSLLTYKKVSVSATPGKTKHFQVMTEKNRLVRNVEN